MTVKSLCICGHNKTDHKKIQQHYLGVYSECEFDTCNCIKFTDKSGNHSTYKTTYRHQRNMKISDLNPLEINIVTCKTCNQKVKLERMNQHIRSHQLEILNDSTRQN